MRDKSLVAPIVSTHSRSSGDPLFLRAYVADPPTSTRARMKIATRRLQLTILPIKLIA
jgi:hypothetical protein